VVPARDSGAASSLDGTAPVRDAAEASVDAAPDPGIEQMHVRADGALSALMLNYWASLAANTTTYDWMFAHYWDAVLGSRAT
jgi:hypothetical protein